MSFWEKEDLTYNDVMNCFISKRTVDTNFNFNKKYVKDDLNFKEIFTEELLNNYDLYDYDKEAVVFSGFMDVVFFSLSNFETSEDVQNYINEYIVEAVSEFYSDDDDDW